MSNRPICIPTDNAFPDPSGDYDGLTKREYFAAMAMQEMVTITCDSFATGADDEKARARRVLVKEAVRFADALIAALNDGRGE